MKNYKFYISVLAFVFISLGAQSCSTLQKPLKEMGTETLLLNAEKNQLKYEYFITDFTFTLSGDNHAEFTGQLRMKKDEIVWLRVASLGVEVARIQITPDSVYIVNRIDKEITVRSTASLLVDYQLNGLQPFEVLQKVLTGGMVLLYAPEMYKSSVDGRAYRIQTIRHLKPSERHGFEEVEMSTAQSIWIEPRNYKVTHLDMKGLEEKDKLRMKYSVFEDVDRQKIPTHVEINYNSESKTEITINYSNPEVDLELGFPFKLPKKYQVK